MVVVYKITSPSGKIYIGQSIDVKRRFMDYKTYGCKGQTKLYNSLKKHGADTHIFEIIESLPDNTDAFVLNNRELFHYMHYINSGNEMLNIEKPSSYRRIIRKTGLHLSDEHKEKIRKALTGIKRTTEFGRKISKSKTGISVGVGHKCSEETRRKISESKLNMYDGNKNPFYGKKHSPETITKIKEKRAVQGNVFNLGNKNWWTPESTAKRIKTITGKKKINGKFVRIS